MSFIKFFQRHTLYLWTLLAPLMHQNQINGRIIRTGSEVSVNPVCSFRSCPKNISHWLSSEFISYSSEVLGDFRYSSGFFPVILGFYQWLFRCFYILFQYFLSVILYLISLFFFVILDLIPVVFR